uniref:F-box domain-containing protein n=1 Tax=Populus trichocarpa TaxID=3694 RepID=A0A3N7FH18_POPTR|eukprot:XP_006380075.2 F-box protein At3g07870 [Populus trichocarpa]
MDDNPRKSASSSQIPIVIASSECLMNKLPSCLIMDILSRLPIKTILNCRCVCKTWLHYISDSFFAKLHLERSPTSLLVKTISNNPESRSVQLVQITGKPVGLRFRVVEEMKFVQEINLPYNNDFLIQNSCNGLLCISQTFQDGSHDDIYLCNPILGEYISIPLAAGQGTRHNSSFSLGYSAITKEYQVLHTFYSKKGPDSQPEAEIYTIGTGKWRGSKLVEKMASPLLKEHITAPVMINFLRAFLHSTLQMVTCLIASLQSFYLSSSDFQVLLRDFR